MGLPASGTRPLRNGRASALTHRSISIVADGRFDVCDDAHRAFVMKEVKGPAQAEAWTDWIRAKARFGPGILWFEVQRRWEERSLRMMIIGCNFHPSWQQIAWLDTETGEAGEQKLVHATGGCQVTLCATGSAALIGNNAGRCIKAVDFYGFWMKCRGEHLMVLLRQTQVTSADDPW
jgi:hypothetical protein